MLLGTVRGSKSIFLVHLARPSELGQHIREQRDNPERGVAENTTDFDTIGNRSKEFDPQVRFWYDRR